MTEAAIPKASTLIVVRPDSTGGCEVLLTRRARQLWFLGGYLVFPGGAVEPSDFSPEMFSRCRGLSPLEAQGLAGGEISPEMALGHWVAAVRELFEETGVHFFVRQNSADQTARPEESNRRLVDGRKALAHGEMDLPRFLAAEDLVCDLSRVRYLFHRITPEKHRVRFDTRFYLAALPQNQTALRSSEEVAESLWITPEAALEQAASEAFPMMPPTVIALRTLSEHPSWSALVRRFELI